MKKWAEKTQPSAGRNVGRGAVFLLMFKLNIRSVIFNWRRKHKWISPCLAKIFPTVTIDNLSNKRYNGNNKRKKHPAGWERIAVLSPPIFVIPTRSRRLYTRECCIFVLTIARLIPESQAYRFIYGERGLAFLFVPCVWTLKNRLPRAMVQIAHRNRIPFAHEGPGACQ